MHVQGGLARSVSVVTRRAVSRPRLRGSGEIPTTAGSERAPIAQRPVALLESCDALF